VVVVGVGCERGAGGGLADFAPSVRELASLAARIGLMAGVGRRKGFLMVRENALAAGGCLGIIPNWVDIRTRVITCYGAFAR
jgi:hypothetical protein